MWNRSTDSDEQLSVSLFVENDVPDDIDNLKRNAIKFRRFLETDEGDEEEEASELKLDFAPCKRRS